MIVKEKKYSSLLNVYGIYWHNDKTYFYCFPKGSFGLSSYGEDEVDIVDRVIESDFVYVNLTHGMHGVFNKKLIDNNLLDQLIDHDRDAYEKFCYLLGKEP